jgi:Xaa-Pro aminopeptidase
MMQLIRAVKTEGEITLLCQAAAIAEQVAMECSKSIPNK